MRLGSLIPNFSAQTTTGPIQFYDWQGNSYVLINIPMICIYKSYFAQKLIRSLKL